MNNAFSIKAYLSQHHGLSVSKGGKYPCPFCHHATLSVKGDELAKCFHPSCGKFISQKTVEDANDLYQELFWEIAHAAHQALMTQGESPSSFNSTAWQYLTQERGVHSQVIEDTPVLGVVPAEFPLENRLAFIEEDLNTRRWKNNDLKEMALAKFETVSERLKNLFSSQAGSLLFTYTDAHCQIRSFKTRGPFTKVIRTYSIFEQGFGMFNPTQFQPEASSVCEGVILAEGEFNALSLQSLLVRQGQSYAKALALGGVNTVDLNSLKQYKERWFLFADHDDAGRELQTQLQSVRTLYATYGDLPDDDLDSFIRRFPDGAQALHAVVTKFRDAKPCYRHLHAITGEIAAIRRTPHRLKKQFEIHDAVGQLVVQELQDRGQFYRTRLAPYYLDFESARLCPITKGTRDAQSLLHRLNLNPSESIHQYVLHELERTARELPSETEVFSFCHYKATSNTLYLYNKDDEVFRIQPYHIDVCRNGVDGVLLTPPPGYTPFQRVDVPQTGEDLLQSLYLARLQFDENQLTADEYRLLLELYVLHLFFDGLHATHPIPVFYGPKGSAKTSSIRRLGLLLFGSQYQVTSLPDKADDFEALVTNGFLVGLDNVDGQVNWLNDKLAVVATGGSIQRRELYTTNSLVSFKVRAYVMLTTRTPKFRRDDVAERLLVFPMKVLTEKVSESALIQEALTHRDRFMSWLLLRLQEVLKLLALTADQPAPPSALRMADFAGFMLRLAQAEDIHDNTDNAVSGIQAIIQKLVDAQSQFTLEHDPLFELLEYLAEHEPYRSFQTSELHTRLQALAQQLKLPYHYASPNSLGQKLGNIKPNLETVMKVTVTTAGQNRKRYQFSPKGS